MTTAALGAVTLQKCLQKQFSRSTYTVTGLTKNFQKQLAQVLKTAWLMATSDDCRWETRVWEKERQHPAVKGLEKKDFVRILEEIALSSWHGDGRTTTVRDIENHCDRSGLKNLLNEFQKKAEEGVTVCYLLFISVKVDRTIKEIKLLNLLTRVLVSI